MSFNLITTEELAKADSLRRATQQKGSARTAREANIQMAIHGASEVLVKGAKTLFSSKRSSTIDAYQGNDDLPEAQHMTIAIAHLIRDVDNQTIKEDAPRTMMRWLVNDILTQAQALRISIGVAHPQFIERLGGDERLTAELALDNTELRRNLDLQKNGRYGDMDEGAQDAIRMDIESGAHLTAKMQDEIELQARIMDRLQSIRQNPGPRLTVLGSIYNEEEQQTGGRVAHCAYSNCTTGNPTLDKAVRATYDFVIAQDGKDLMVDTRITSAQAMVAHNYEACRHMDENQLSHRILAMYQIVTDAAKLQNAGRSIILIEGLSEDQNKQDAYGITTFEFGSMSPRGRSAMNDIIGRGLSLSTSQKMGLVQRLQLAEEARENVINLPAITKKAPTANSIDNDVPSEIRQIRAPAKPSIGVLGAVREAIDSLSR